MQIKTFGAFIAGVVLCAGITGGGMALAGPDSAPAKKRINVKLEWISVTSSGTKVSDTLAVSADAGQKATSDDRSSREGTDLTQTAEVQGTVNADGSATLVLNCDVTKSGKENSIATYKTTITLGNGETKVLKGFSRKTQKENSETLLFVTASF